MIGCFEGESGADADLAWMSPRLLASGPSGTNRGFPLRIGGPYLPFPDFLDCFEEQIEFPDQVLQVVNDQQGRYQPAEQLLFDGSALLSVSQDSAA
jgi:hypothetical protein